MVNKIDNNYIKKVAEEISNTSMIPYEDLYLIILNWKILFLQVLCTSSILYHLFCHLFY